MQSTALVVRFSALQRAEIAEIANAAPIRGLRACFSALQRAEIAEISSTSTAVAATCAGFSALQRAEIAEIELLRQYPALRGMFQCSSTSRNC